MTKTGLVEVEILTKNDQNSKDLTILADQPNFFYWFIVSGWQGQDIHELGQEQ